MAQRGLRNSAYLVVQESPTLDDTREAVFELRNIIESGDTQEPRYIVGGGGEFLRSANRFLTDRDSFTASETSQEFRAGYWIDGGAGDWTETITFQTGGESSVPLRWGDERSAAGEANVTATDASGSDVNPLTRRQVLSYWLAETRSDSFGHTRLHIGEWTDGRFDDYQDGQKIATDAGVYGRPISGALLNSEFSRPEDESSTFTGTISLAHTALFPVTESQLATVWNSFGLETPTLGPADAFPQS